MGAKTYFTREELADLLVDYRLGEYLHHHPFEHGGDQTNILVVTTKGKCVFRYYEKRSFDYVLFEIDLLRYLTAHSFPCPAPIKSEHDRYVGVYNGKPFSFFAFLPGEHSDDADHYQRVAEVIGKLHTLTDGYKPSHAEARVSYDPESCLAIATANSRKINHEADARSRLAWLQAELNKLQAPDDIPWGACHGDCNPTNFLYQDGNISAVLDFDQSNYNHLVYDVAILIYWWTWPVKGWIDFNKSRLLLEAYESARVLSDAEKVHLYDMLKMINFMGYAWFIFDAEDCAGSRHNVEELNMLGRDGFYQMLFGLGGERFG
jgi:homoserine kinase type II